MSCLRAQLQILSVYNHKSPQLPVRGVSSWVKRANSLGQPIRAILFDYAEVFKELFQSAWKTPIKSITYLSMGSLTVAAVRTRPDYRGYINNVLEYANDLSMCSEAVRNPMAKCYIDDIIKMHSNGYLTYINLGIVALIMRKAHSAYCSNFHETCPSLQPRLWTWKECVMDVGVWGQWLLLETELKDYDVNNEQSDLSSQQ